MLWMFYLFVCHCTMCMSGAHGGQKRTVDSLELELQMVGNHHRAAGNRIIESESSGKAASVLTAELSLQPQIIIFFFCINALVYYSKTRQ